MCDVFQVASSICGKSNWEISNLPLQKLVYVAQMLHMGNSDMEEPFFEEEFEAWLYGPVCPILYDKVKRCGSDHIKESSLPHDEKPFFNSLQEKIIERVVKMGKEYSTTKLIALAHWDGGAWKKNYISGIKKTIPKRDIRQEFDDMVAL